MPNSLDEHRIVRFFDILSNCEGQKLGAQADNVTGYSKKI